MSVPRALWPRYNDRKGSAYSGRAPARPAGVARTSKDPASASAVRANRYSDRLPGSASKRPAWTSGNQPRNIKAMPVAANGLTPGRANTSPAAS